MAVAAAGSDGGIPVTSLSDCGQPPPAELIEGVRLFNAGEFHACHEILEELWLAERGTIRRLYQGILQIGVGLHHLQRGNEQGAMALLVGGKDYLRSFAPICRGVDVAALIGETERVRQTLISLGVEPTRALGSGIFPRIRLITAEGAS